MARMTVTLDETLVDHARELLGVRTKREAIEAALKAVVRHARLAEIAARCGKVEFGITREELEDQRSET